MIHEEASRKKSPPTSKAVSQRISPCETHSMGREGEEHLPLLGVALSGGGVRASLFTLGALIYLVDSSACERVTAITSVSGGSITNGFVAQRCNFQNVKPREFDQYASELAKAITSGLVSKRFVIATYGLLGIGMLGIGIILATVFSRRFGLLVAVDVVLIALFGVLLLLRGSLLALLFQRQLFGFSGLPRALGSIPSAVAHIFCATDLNGGMPVYFTNVGRHFYSPAWGRAAQNQASQIRVADVVRASAAFPGGIPPKRMKVHDFDLSPTPLHKLKRLQQLAFQESQEQPSVLYLADGGVWNNLGTDWFEPATDLLVMTGADWHPKATQRLIVDATAPPSIKVHLRGFWVPYLAEVLALFRDWLVSYTSTVSARIEDLVSPAAESDVSANRPKVQFVARIIDPLSGSIKLGRIVWLGEPDYWSGRAGVGMVFKSLLRAKFPVRRPVVRDFACLQKWTARVPTTLFSIPPEIALQLVMHGYLSTAQVMSKSADDALSEFPGVERFAKLFGLETHRLSDMNATFVGSALDLEKHSQQIKENLAKNRNELIGQDTSTAKIAVSAAEDMQVDTVQVLIATEQEVVGQFELDLTRAKLAYSKRDFRAAVDLFDRVFSQVVPTHDSVELWSVVEYAYALAQIGDERAKAIALAAEERVRTEVLKKVALAWFNIAEVYTLQRDADGVVRCLRASLAHEPTVTRTWLASPKEMKVFQPIRSEPIFAEFENQVLGVPATKIAAAK